MELQPANNIYYRNSGYGIRNVEKEDKKSRIEKAGSAIRKTGNAVDIAGNFIENTGLAAEIIGDSASSASKIASTRTSPGLVRSGEKLSLSGSKLRSSGRTISETGKTITRVGSSTKIAKSGLLSKAKLLIKTPLNFTNLLVGAFMIKLWIAQVFFALMGIVMIAIAAGFAMFQSAQLFGLSPQRIIELVRLITGISLDMAENSLALFFVFNIIALIFGFISLLIIAAKSIISLESPFWGKKSTLKILAFLGAIVLYTFPITNLFPWVTMYWLVLVFNRDF